MKKFILFFMTLLLAVMTLSSCKERPRLFKSTPWGFTSPKDSLSFCKDVAKVIEFEKSVPPSFGNAIDVMLYRQRAEQEFYIDSCFSSLPAQTIANVASVILKRQDSFTILELVQEYETNKRIYDGLPKDDKKDSIKAPPLTKETSNAIDTTSKQKQE